MNPLSFLTNGGLAAVGKAADALFTSDEERLRAEIDIRKLDLEASRISQARDLAQIEVNKVEATHRSMFVAGWRPAIGWVAALALGYQFILYPLLIWVWAFAQSQGWLPADLPPPPVLDTGALVVILTGMLGIGGLRTLEKSKGLTK